MTARPLPCLMVAPNGARRGKADHPALPVTPEEIVETAVACREAGADGIHLHVRDDLGRHSLDAGLYRAVIGALEQAVPGMFVQVTSESAGLYDAGAQRAMVRELCPASVSVALREMIRSAADARPARAFYHWAHGEGVAVQHIVYSPEELAWLIDCIDDATVPGRRHQVQLVLGSYQGTDLPRPADIEPFLSRMERRKGDLAFDWMVCAFGKAETDCLAHAVSGGGKVRVGFENSLWNADGSLARDNAERVAEVRAAIDRIEAGGAASQTVSPCDR